MKWLFLIVVMIMLFSASCNGKPADENAGDESLSPTEASSESLTGEFITGKANVESVEILVLESFPVQVNVVARGHHPDGCTQISNAEQDSIGEFTISFTIFAVRPTDVDCTQENVPFEETFPLDVEGLPAGNYTVEVNDITGSFELEVDNVSVAGPDTTCPTGTMDLAQFLNGMDGYCLLHQLGIDQPHRKLALLCYLGKASVV